MRRSIFKFQSVVRALTQGNTCDPLNILLAKRLLGCYCPTRILLTGNVYWIILNTQNMLVIKNKQKNKKLFH